MRSAPFSLFCALLVLAVQRLSCRPPSRSLGALLASRRPNVYSSLPSLRGALLVVQYSAGCLASFRPLSALLAGRRHPDHDHKRPSSFISSHREEILTEETISDSMFPTMTTMFPTVSSSRFEICIFYFERSISKFDLRSGQVKVRSRSSHDPSRSICISSEAS